MFSKMDPCVKSDLHKWIRRWTIFASIQMLQGLLDGLEPDQFEPDRSGGLDGERHKGSAISQTRGLDEPLLQLRDGCDLASKAHLADRACVTRQHFASLGARDGEQDGSE